MADPALAFVLKMTVECFVNKVKDEAAASLRDGDITELRFREVILRELNDIKLMLRGMVRQDLITSIINFHDGIELLYYYLNRIKEEKEKRAALQEEEEEFRKAMNSVIKRVSSKTRKSAEQLMSAVEKHVINSHSGSAESVKMIDSAREHFKQASFNATRAISNQGMSGEDRVLAYKVKIAAILLESFQDPEIAIPLCKKALEELTSMTLVKNACQVQFGKSLSSQIMKRFHFEERDVLIRSVASVHRTMWHYIRAVSPQRTGVPSALDIVKWPLFEVENRKLHPIHDQEFASYNYWNFGKSAPGEKRLNQPNDIAINSLGEFIVCDTNNGCISVWSKRGEFMYDLKLVNHEDPYLMVRPRGVAVDNQNRIFVTDSVSNVVHVFEGDCKFSSNSFTKPNQTQNEMSNFSGIHVNGSDRVLVSDVGMKCIHVFTTEGAYLYSLGKDELGSLSDASSIYSSYITSTKEGAVLVTDARHGCVRVYDDRDVKTISLDGKPFRPVGIAYDSLSREIFVSDDHSKHIFVFSESGEYTREMKYNVVLGVAGLKVTCDGHVALVDDKRSLVHVF